MRITFNFILLIFLFFIQIIFLPYLGILRYLNLVFCCLTIYRLIDRKFFLFYLILGGLLFDSYSVFPKGYYLVLFLLAGLIVNWFVERIGNFSFLNVLIIGLFSTFIYQFFFLIINQSLHWLKIIPQPIIFNKAYFIQTGLFILLNSLIILSVQRLCSTHLKLKAPL